MPLPTIPGVVRASFSGKVPSLQSWANVWHFRYAGGASSPGDSDIAALHALAIRIYSGAVFGAGAAWFTNCHASVTLTRALYVRLDGTALGVEYPLALAGSGGGGSIPSECAPVLTLRSAQRGRSHRGRVYLPVPNTASVVTDGRLISSVPTKTVAQVQGLMAALGGPTVTPFWEIGIASYLLGVFTPLVLPTMDADVDVQRRRKN